MQYGSMKNKTALVAGISHSCNYIAKSYLNAMWMANKNIHLSEHGDEALATAQKQLFDIIVVDANLPEVDGIALAKKVREQYKWSSPKIIGYSSYLPDDMENIFDANVMKPSTRKEFETTLMDVLKRSDLEK